jgi:hypothetical protein
MGFTRYLELVDINKSERSINAAAGAPTIITVTVSLKHWFSTAVKLYCTA